GVSKLHHLTVEANPCDAILQHLQSVAPAFSARRVSGRRERLAGGTARARLYVLGPIRGDAVRPTRARAFAARDLRWLGELRGQAGASRGGGAAPVDPRVRQCASALAAVSSRLLSGPGAVSRGGRLEAVPVQEQVAQPRRHRNRSVRG